MKIAKILGLTVGLALTASLAVAQSYSLTGSKAGLNVARGYISGTTPVTDQPIFYSDADVYVVHRCGSVVSMSILNKLSDGTVVNSQTVACDTTTRIVSFTAPLYFEAIALSPTTAVSTTTGGASATIIQTRK